jgi:hypothetical protein
MPVTFSNSILYGLVLIRQEIEERLMPSFVAMHDRSTPPEAD